MILDGKQIAQEIRSELREEVQSLIAHGLRVPKLAVVIVGHNPASETYVSNKIKACAEVGIEAERIALEADITEKQLLEEVERLNNDPSVDGFIVQLPLPEHISETTIMSAINYRKDVDGLTPDTGTLSALSDSDGRQTCGRYRSVEHCRETDCNVAHAASVPEFTGYECRFLRRCYSYHLSFQNP